MSGDSVTKNDLDEVETQVDIVARQAGSLTGRLDTLIERLDTLVATMVTRDHLAAELAALREDINRNIARHMEAGLERMRQLFTSTVSSAATSPSTHET